MPTAVLTPRVNNNDDTVRLTRFHCAAGAFVRTGDLIAEVETDKASFTVEVEQEGYVLGFVQPVGEMIPVGSVLAWLGQSADEPLPVEEPAPTGAGVAKSGAEPTLKAAILLKRYGLSTGDVPAAGPRLTGEEVQAHAQRLQLDAGGGAPADRAHTRVAHAAVAPPAPATPPADVTPGARVPLTVAERGMLRTVLWHRDVAAPGYVEIDFETAPWDRYAAAFRDRHQLLMDPLLPLLAHRLVQIAKENPKLNSTIVNDERHEYTAINLGFTIQSGSRLLLLCVRNADALGDKAFADALGTLMRQGMKEKLTAEQTSGVTLSFSSMARWQVMRHIPVLAPYTSLMLAHAHGSGGRGTLGATYDHRVLTGGEVAVVLRALTNPPEGDAGP